MDASEETRRLGLVDVPAGERDPTWERLENQLGWYDRMPAGWIPIREANSPPAPFDFAAERILYVPRSNSGELNRTRLSEMLADRIRALLRKS